MSTSAAAAPRSRHASQGRVAQWLRTREGGLLLLALVVGAGAGGGAVAFRYLITLFTHVFSGHADYSNVGHAAHPAFPWLGMYFVVLAPVVSGLLYGPLVYFFAREARGHGVPEVMYAVHRAGGRIKPQVAVVKALASALCIGGGGSVGREGPIVQIGSALGSTLGGLVRVAEGRMRVLVACGAAGGIAATFNAPLAGVFFAMELILIDFTARSFGMVVISSVTASVIGRAAFGDTSFLVLPPFRVDHLSEYALFAVLGLIGGLAGVLFTRVLYVIEDLCDAVWRGPEWARPAVGGVVLGLLLLAVPQMYGVGYPVLGNGVAGRYAIGFLLVLIVAKMIATSLTIGIGGSGGVFAPSLFIGAMLGAAYGEGLQHLFPGSIGAVGAYGLIGMGAVFAGAARAPITAVVILFELTGEYSIILPMMTAIVLATGVSQLVTKDTIYSLKLRRRGVFIGGSPAETALGAPVSAAMREAPQALPGSLPLLEAIAILGASREGALPVVDDEGVYVGVVAGRTVAEMLGSRDDPQLTVADATTEVPTVRTDQTLAEASDALGEAHTSAIGVVDDERLVGWITGREVLGALQGPADIMRD